MNLLCVFSTSLLAALTLSSALAQTSVAPGDASPLAAAQGGTFGTWAGTYRGNSDGGIGAYGAESTSAADPYARGWAAGSLATAALHASAVTSPQPCSWVNCRTTSEAIATVAFWDTITFVNGQNTGLAPVRLVVDGTRSVSGSWTGLHWYMGRMPSDFWRDTSRYTEFTELFSGTTEVGDDLLVPLGETTWFIYARMTVQAASYGWNGGGSTPGFADFGNTLHVQWTLPEGVSFSSASGQFMSAVPEPASVLPMLAGLAVLGAWRQARAKRA
jgi:hypothetical protein